MPIPPRTVPARVPNFSYDTGPRDLNLLDSTVQRDMARTRRTGPGDRSRPMPFAAEGNDAGQPLRVSKRKIEPRNSRSWSPPSVTTRRCNHLQNSPSQWLPERCKVAPGTSQINTSSLPAPSGGYSSQRLKFRRDRPAGGQSRINDGSNIFGPPTAPYSKPPPPPAEPFVQRQRGGHIRPTLLGMTDAYKFADKERHHADMMRERRSVSPQCRRGATPERRH